MSFTFGSTGIEVLRIGFGGMPLSLAKRPPDDEGVKVLHAGLDAGINFIDTANVYCQGPEDLGHNERLIARALREWPKKKDILVATKAGMRRIDGSWEINGHPDFIKKSCEQSLKALNVDRIFLYQHHKPDPQVPFLDSISAFIDLQREGKIEHIGLSNVSAEQIEDVLKLCSIQSIQNRFHPLAQDDLHNGVIDLCQKEKITYIAYSPIGGWRAREQLVHNEVIKEIAAKYDATPYQILISWALAQNPVVFPIPGASKISSIQSSVAAMKIILEVADVQKITDLNC